MFLACIKVGYGERSNPSDLVNGELKSNDFVNGEWVSYKLQLILSCLFTSHFSPFTIISISNLKLITKYDIN